MRRPVGSAGRATQLLAVAVVGAMVLAGCGHKEEKEPCAPGDTHVVHPPGDPFQTLPDGCVGTRGGTQSVGYYPEYDW